MNLQENCELVLSYTRYMTLPLLLIEPQNVLIIGVGGGSSVRFLHHYFPYTIIDGVDNSTEVLQIAHDYFALPSHANINMHCMLGEVFLAQTQKSFDLIQIDAFDQNGMAASIYNSTFFSLCGTSLTEDGLLCCNIWGNNQEHLDSTKKALENIFPCTIYIPVPNRGNIIAISSRKSIDWNRFHPRHSALARKNNQLNQDFLSMVKVARQANLTLWSQFLSTLKDIYTDLSQEKTRADI